MIFTDEFKIYPFITSMGIVFTLTSIIGELQKSFRSSYNNNNSLSKTILQLLSKNRHKNGGYIVHIGITLLFVGFVGRAFEVEKEFVLRPGGSTSLTDYKFILNNVTSEERDNHFAFISDMEVWNNEGDYITTLHPEKRIYFHRNPDPDKRQPHSELDIHSTLNKDIYSVFSSYDPKKNEAYFKIMINPLVNWVWIGGIVIIFGALFAFWPSSRRDHGTV